VFEYNFSIFSDSLYFLYIICSSYPSKEQKESLASSIVTSLPGLKAATGVSGYVSCSITVVLLFCLILLPFLQKMQFFKISVKNCFFVDLLFYFFFPPMFLNRFLTDLHQIWHERPIWYAIYTEARFFGEVQKLSE